MREPLPAALAAGHGSPLKGSSAAEKRSTEGVGFGLAEVGAFYWTVLAPDIVNPGREEQGSVSV